MTPLDQVREWSIAFGAYVADEPSYPGKAIAALRVSLIEEEIDELEESVLKRDAVATLDALCDLEYVVQGSFLAFGLDRTIRSLQEHHLQEVLLRPIGLNLKSVESVIVGMRQQVGKLYIGLGEKSGPQIQEALSNLLHKIDMSFAISGLEPIRREAFDHVHFCNLSKLGQDGKPIKRPDGKILKGPNTVKPEKRLGELIEGLGNGRNFAKI